MKKLFIPVIGLFVSCSFFSGDTDITICEPPPHPASAFFSLDHYVTVFLSEDNTVTETVWLPGSGREMIFPKEYYTPVLIYPVYKEIGKLRFPAGAVFFPSGGTEDKIIPEWELGPLAWIMMKTGEKEWPLEYFNWIKFKETIEENCDENVWFMDFQRISDALSENSISIYDIKYREIFSVTITALPEGLYIPENPFLPILSSVSEDEPVRISLVEGIHFFYHNRTASILEISVSNTGDALWYLNRSD